MKTTASIHGINAAHNVINELCNLNSDTSAVSALELEILNAARIGPDDLNAERIESIRAFCEIIAPMLAEHCNHAEPELTRTESEGGEL